MLCSAIKIAVFIVDNHIKSNQILRSACVIVLIEDHILNVKIFSMINTIFLCHRISLLCIVFKAQYIAFNSLPPPPPGPVDLNCYWWRQTSPCELKWWSSFILFVEKNCHHYPMSSQLSKLVRIRSYTNVYTRYILNTNQIATLCRDVRIRLISNRKFHLDNFIWTYFLVS